MVDITTYRHRVTLEVLRTRSMFTIGYGYGLWVGILASMQLPYTAVRPAVWKKAFSLGKDKEASGFGPCSFTLGQRLRLKKHHGRAEALLLAHYGLRQRQR